MTHADDISAYLNSIERECIEDISFSQNMTFNRTQTSVMLSKITEIKAYPILQSTPLEHKVNFYLDTRKYDGDIVAIEGKAIHQLRSISSLDPINIGSFGLGLNISSSDIDLGIGLLNQRDFTLICEKLVASGFEYKQARETRYISPEKTTKRFVLTKTIDGFDLDISVYHACDLWLLSNGNAKCRSTMTLNEKAEHTWNKFMLKEHKMIYDYSIYKLEPYITYKPGFKWLSLT